MAEPAVCYCRHSNQVIVCPTLPNSPCSNDTSGIQQCCATGDTCGEDGFCHFTHPSEQNLSGYYIGGCTDSNFEDPKCVQECTDHPTQDAIYNSTTTLWSCCYGSGALDCSIPSNETFQSPAPEQLFNSLSTTIVSTSSTSTSTGSPNTSSQATIAPAVTTSATVASTIAASASGLSTGAQAGLEVGISVAGLLFLAGLIFFCCVGHRAQNPLNTNERPGSIWKMRKNFDSTRKHYKTQGERVGELGIGPGDALNQRYLELDDARPYKPEIDGITRSELDAGAISRQRS